MHGHCLGEDRTLQVGEADPEMTDPDGRIYQNHPRFSCDRRQPGTSNFGIVSPRASSRRPPSRCTKPSRASRMRAVFYLIPVYSVAEASKSSSIFSVVLMRQMMTEIYVR